MKRLKKMFVAGLMTVVTGFACVGSAVANFAKTFFSFGSVNAAVGENTNTESGNAVVKGKIITVSNFPLTENLERGQTVGLPYLGTNTEGSISDVVVAKDLTTTGFETGDQLYVEITNPYGKKLTEYDATVSAQGDYGKTAVTTDGVGQVSYDDTSKKLKFTPSIAGIYEVQYYIKNAAGTWTSSPVYELSVQKTTSELKMVENSATVMPSTIKVENESTAVTVGLPLVYDKEGNLVTDDIILGDKFVENGEDYYYVAKYESRATAENKVKLGEVTNVIISDEVQNDYAEYKTYYIRKVKVSDYDNATNSTKAQYRLYVEAGNQTNATVAGTKTALNLVNSTAITEQGVVYDLHSYQFNASKGMNIVQYKLCLNNNAATIDEPETYFTKTIEGKSTYDTEVELAATPAKKFLSTDLEYGEKVYLPTVSAVDLKNNKASVNVFYYYKVRVKTKDGYSTDKVTMGKDEKGFYFIPLAATGSTYEIYYNVRDFYGNVVEDDDNSDSPNYYQVSITDRKAPTVSFARSFDGLASDISTEDLTDYSYSIPTKVKIGDVIAVPAIYASDNSGISSITRSISSKDKTFKSTKKNETTSTNVSGTIYLTRQDGTTDSSSGFYLEKEGSKIDDIVTFSDVDNSNFKVESNKFTKKTGDFENDEYMRAKNSQVVFVKIDENVFGAGTYTLTLNATDKALNSNSSSRTYTFEVVEDDVDYGTPTVAYGKSTINNVTENQEFKLAVPAISDSSTKNLVRYYAVITGNDGSLTYHQLSLDDDGENIVVKMDEKVGSTDKTLYDLVSETTVRNFEIRTYVMNYGSSFYTTNNNRVALAGATKVQAEELILNWFKEYDKATTEDKDKSVAMASYKISLKNLDDTSAPKFASDTTSTIFAQDTIAVEQFKEIEVDGVKFTDNTSSAYVYAEVRDTKGNIYNYSERGALVIKASGEQFEYEFPGIKFTPTNADAGNYYTITYYLQDRGGNTVSYSIVLVQATDKEAPIISGVDSSDSTIELGETLNLSQIVATDNQSADADVTLIFEVKDANGESVNTWCNNYEKTFTPQKVGTYTVYVSAKDGEGNVSAKNSFTVKVEDTLKPVIYLNGDTTDEISYSEDDISAGFQEVSIPTFTVKDQKPENSTVAKSGVFGATGSIKLSAPTKGSDSKSEYEYDMQGNLKDGTDRFSFKLEDGMFKFTPDARGTYTITYTATDLNGNSAENEKTITIRVGDTEAPQIILTSKLKNTLDSGFVLGGNTTLKINTNARIYSETEYASEDIYLKDNVSGYEGFNCKEYKEADSSEVLYHYYTVGVTITDGNSSKVSSTSNDDGYLTYDFTTAGTYTITFTATDKAGNKETWSRQFKVVAPESSTSEKTTIIGTILIIISVIVLAGVVLYFIKGTKIAKNRKKGKKAESKKNDKIEA